MNEPLLHKTTFAELIKDGLLDITDGYRAKNSELGGNGPMFLRAGHVTDSHIDFAGVERFHEHLLPKLRDKLSAPGDVIITTKGNSTGRTSYVTRELPQFVYSPHLSRWRSLDKNRLEPGFLRYWCRSREFVEQLRGMMVSTDMAPYLSLRDQRRLTISLLPIEDQRAAAHLLGSLDDRIELNRRMNRTLEALARAVFRAWFVDFEPVKAKAAGTRGFIGMPQAVFDELPSELVESDLGRIPLGLGWRVASIADIGEYVNGRAFTKDATGTGRMVVRIAELNSGPGASTQYTDIETEPENTAFPDDLLFAWSGSLGVYRWHREEAIINQHIFKVIPRERPKWYAYYRLLEAMPFFAAIASTKATTMGHIKRSHLSDARFVEPTNVAIRAAGEVIQPLFELVHSNERESLQLASVRDALLPRLVSGKLHAQEVA